MIEHGANIGDFVHIAPNATVLGDVKIGSGTFVGSSTVIQQGVRIGKNCFVNAGLFITKNIPDRSTILCT